MVTCHPVTGGGEVRELQKQNKAYCDGKFFFVFAFRSLVVFVISSTRAGVCVCNVTSLVHIKANVLFLFLFQYIVMLCYIVCVFVL